jgi:hypothetical protein
MSDSDKKLLEEVQRRAIGFFWEKADPNTGLVNDRANNFGPDDETVASIASTGYGLAALPIGLENGWLDRYEAADRARRTLRFLLNMPEQHGWLVHFIDRRTGDRVWGSEYSSIDTALLVAGALVCGQYFGREPATADISGLSEELYRRLDWWWMLTNGGREPAKKVLSHGWWPESGFITNNYVDYSEAILLYLLGLGAVVRQLPSAAWDAFERPARTYAGIEWLQAGPIFIHQMPHGYFDLRDQRDRLGFDYWVASTHAMRIHRQYCIDHAGERQTYAHGFWGLNASDGPNGYVAYGIAGDPEDGTVSPTGALSSITFVPELAISAARALFEKDGNRLWGTYGFVNSFNIDRNWASSVVIGIDLGMALLAIENYRSGLIWNLMNSLPAARRGLAAAGFHPTTEPAPRPVHLPAAEERPRVIG